MGHWTPSFYGYDGIGDVRQLTNASGAVMDTYEYDAFGNKIASTGTTPNNYLHRGEQYDTNLGQYYLRARYYNPLTGRFLARDPAPGNIAIPATLHKYLFTGGDPVNWVDPTGRADLAETGEIDLNVSEGATAGEEATAREVSCILDTAGALLAAVSPSPELQGILVAVQINGQQCDAAAEREEAPKEVEPEPGPQENPCPPTGATRYVSEGELNVIRQTGRVPNTNRLGLPKQVFYTPEDPLQSAEAAFNAYQLPEMPSHVVTLDTSGVTNSYAGNVEGSPFNIEMVTHESIPVTCIEPLAP